MELTLHEINVLIHGCDLVIAKALTVLEDSSNTDKDLIDAYQQSMIDAQSLQLRLGNERIIELEKKKILDDHRIVSPMNLAKYPFVFGQIYFGVQFKVILTEGVELLNFKPIDLTLPLKEYFVSFSKDEYKALLAVVDYLDELSDYTFSDDNPVFDETTIAVTEFNLCSTREQKQEIFLEWLNDYRCAIQLRIDLL
jgi:hypothetical protein